MQSHRDLLLFLALALSMSTASLAIAREIPSQQRVTAKLKHSRRYGKVAIPLPTGGSP
jgi:hypothetical protein